MWNQGDTGRFLASPPRRIVQNPADPRYFLGANNVSEREPGVGADVARARRIIGGNRTWADTRGDELVGAFKELGRSVQSTRSPDKRFKKDGLFYTLAQPLAR
jgi:hypothetical protein